MKQEIRPFFVITSDTPKPFYSEEEILVMNVYDFLMDSRALEM